MVLFSLTFVRHGETLYNRRNIIQGQSDIPLSSLGEKQAQLVAERLQNERFTHIFSSDLSRAHETAKAISDCNRVCRCDITLDRRLRERRFGSAEGKTSKELLLSAKKAKRRYTDYTPPGAESVAQVQERAQLFFKDLCKICMSLSECNDLMYTPAKIKRRHGGSLGRNSRHSKRLQINGRSQSFCGSGNVQNFINEINWTSDFDDDDENENNFNENFCKHSDFASMQASESSEFTAKVIEDYQYRECFPSSSEDSNLSGSDLKSNGSSKSDGLSNSETDDSSLSSSSSFNQTGTESDSTLPENITHTVQSIDCEIQTEPLYHRRTFQSPSPKKRVAKDLISSTDSCLCPNISLSPSTHRLSSISSISSGRNSSFDDIDALPTTLADILVVSHGGFIKETMKYFVDTLGCSVPGVKGHALKVCPNCSISKFTITLDEDTFKPSLTCVTIHDKDHLAGLEVPDAKGIY
ncbi:uncharacterized protein LOC123552906 [Mercenaria mercenaria]|uniref:uncharacterized protein LOC123552906 n=1 Tax=Mercenaria mercenaria TaxID=6596 RepID=UPI00234ED0E9|nr:uncharacterized protein LOC123552906 [Mercenaria mercenaria]